MADEADYSSWTAEQIKARLAELRITRAALDAEELRLVAALDRANAYIEAGANSTAAMLAHEAQISTGSARRLVDLARSIEALPQLGEAVSTGTLSSEVAAEVAKFATPETEGQIIDRATNWSAGEARTEARRAVAIDDAEQRRINSAREVRLRWNSERTWLELSGRLGAEAGARLQSALERIVTTLPKKTDGERVPYPARMADALVELASSRIASDADRDRATVSVHVDYETLVSGRGVAEIGAGYVSAEVARRIACDARLEFVLDDPHGLCLGVGRTSRTPPPWLARQVRHRDLVCQFPSCERAYGLEIHHIVHWADGGPTDYDNLVLICWDHHSLIHEGGWRLAGSAARGLVFTGPWGERVEVPAADSRRLRRRRPTVESRPSGRSANKPPARVPSRRSDDNHQAKLPVARARPNRC